MVEHMSESMVTLRRHVDQWKIELREAEATPGPIATQFAETLRRRIAEAEKVIADSGF